MTLNKPGPKHEDLTGKIYGKLQVIKYAEQKVNQRRSYWLCKCDCGNNTIIRASHLKSGGIRSCGCLKTIACSVNKTHNLSKTKFYKIWQGIKQRCSNLNDCHFIYYGGRGIRVCDRWLRFENFRDDMYESYIKHIEEFGEKDTSIDRIDVNGNYEPNNCRWATWNEQGQRKRTTSKTIAYKEHKYQRGTLCSMLSNAIKRKSHACKRVEYYLGCSLLEFRRHIESKFINGMTWNNHGWGKNTWQIDHIIGCNNFDLSLEDRKRCFYYTNLQPLWWKDHTQKSRLT